MDERSYVINKVGPCRNCVADADELLECYKCQSLLCVKHYNETECELCRNVPYGHDICIICDNHAECYMPFDKDCTSPMAFSSSYTSPYTIVRLCKYCRVNHLTPLIYPITTVRYQSLDYILNKYANRTGDGPQYDDFRLGNNTNYKLIQDCRKKITTHYNDVVGGFMPNDIVIIIVGYCGFARDIVFVPCDEKN